jgi:hypothetical protein
MNGTAKTLCLALLTGAIAVSIRPHFRSHRSTRAAHISKASLAQKWITRLHRLLPWLAPPPNRFGV